MLGRDPYTFINIARVALDVILEIAAFGTIAKDDPPLEHAKVSSSEKDKGPSPLFAKPPRAPRSNRRTKLMHLFFFFY